MTTEQKYEWAETGYATLEATAGLWVHVSDGVIGHATALAEAIDLPAALRDYAAGYDAGAQSCECDVWWTVFKGGTEVDAGRYTWDYPIR